MIDRAFPACVLTACSYEVLAIATGRVPTISRLCRGRWWAKGLILGGLARHLTSGAYR